MPVVQCMAARGDVLASHMHIAHARPAAVVTYYCGSAATSGEEGDVYGSKQLLSLLGVLRDSPPAVRASAIRGLLALGPGLTRAGSRWQQQAQQQNDNSWYSGLDDDYEEDEELWGWAEEEAEEGDDEALAGSVQQLAGWDGQPLPQLIFRCHVYGDMDVVRCQQPCWSRQRCALGIAAAKVRPDDCHLGSPHACVPALARTHCCMQSGHTFVIAMQPDGMVFDVYQVGGGGGHQECDSIVHVKSARGVVQFGSTL